MRREMKRAFHGPLGDGSLDMELAYVNRVTAIGKLVHPVKEPITAAVINAQAALRWLETEPPNLDEAREALSQSVQQGRRAGDIIHQVQAFMRRTPPRKCKFDLNDAILEVAALTEAQAVGHGVSLQNLLVGGLPWLEANRVQLQQVVLNLIQNAIEALAGMTEGRRELQIGTSKDASNGLIVTVRDSGPGLDETSPERFFEPFYTTKPEALGLGLSISRSIVESHGGQLWASSNIPQGAVFQFTLPCLTDGTSYQWSREKLAGR